jgi:hypothetical protein
MIVERNPNRPLEFKAKRKGAQKNLPGYHHADVFPRAELIRFLLYEHKKQNRSAAEEEEDDDDEYEQQTEEKPAANAPVEDSDEAQPPPVAHEPAAPPEHVLVDEKKAVRSGSGSGNQNREGASAVPLANPQIDQKDVKSEGLSNPNPKKSKSGVAGAKSSSPTFRLAGQQTSLARALFIAQHSYGGAHTGVISEAKLAEQRKLKAMIAKEAVKIRAKLAQSRPFSKPSAADPLCFLSCSEAEGHAEFCSNGACSHVCHSQVGHVHGCPYEEAYKLMQ